MDGHEDDTRKITVTLHQIYERRRSVILTVIKDQKHETFRVNVRHIVILNFTFMTDAYQA